MAVADSVDRPRSIATSGDIDADRQRHLELQQVERARSGDAMAFRAIIERHNRGIFALTRRLVGCAIEAEDLTQEAFARAYRSLDGYDPEYRLSTWLYRIALNACRDYLKSARRRERPTEHAILAEAAWDGPAPEATMDAARRAVRVRAALELLAPAYREALVLKDMQELSYDEMHAITGSPVTALKIRVLRARAKLRKLLEEP